MKALAAVLTKLSAQLIKIRNFLNTMPSKTAPEKLYDFAKACLDTDASPLDSAPDEFGCADSVNQIYKHVFGRPIASPGTSTLQLYQAMKADKIRFQEVDESEADAGDIIISPTTLGTNPDMPNGHVGILGFFGIMSNDSRNGLWMENYKIASWLAHYHDVGGYPVCFFRALAF